MARMHARRRGRSGSTKPVRDVPPSWMQLSEKEIIETVVKLGKEGYSTSEIGIKLRDQYGVPSVYMATNKKITKILREHDITFKLPEDLKNLMKHAVKLNTHVEHNPKDHHNRRGLQLIEAKIRRLSRYYIRKGVLPHDWKYSLETAKLLVD